MLEEIRRRPGTGGGEEGVSSSGGAVAQDREGYALAAGLALGLVTLGRGQEAPGLADIQMADRLKYDHFPPSLLARFQQKCAWCSRALSTPITLLVKAKVVHLLHMKHTIANKQRIHCQDAPGLAGMNTADCVKCDPCRSGSRAFSMGLCLMFQSLTCSIIFKDIYRSGDTCAMNGIIVGGGQHSCVPGPKQAWHKSLD